MTNTSMEALQKIVADPKVAPLLIGGETPKDVIDILNRTVSNGEESNSQFLLFVEKIRKTFANNPEMLVEVDGILNGGDDIGTKAIALQNLSVI